MVGMGGWKLWMLSHDCDLWDRELWMAEFKREDVEGMEKGRACGWRRMNP